MRMRRALTALTGVLALGAAGAVVVGGERLPVEQLPVAAVDVAVPATATAQVCPGPPRLATAAAGEDLTYDEFDPEGSGTASVVAALSLGREDQPPGELRLGAGLEGPDADSAVLTGTVRRTELADAGRSALLAAGPVDDEPALATGTSLALTPDGDLRGLSATPCQTPATSVWLVGGSTAPGDSAQLVLANAGDTAATVTLSGWGSTGPLDLSAAGAVLVPPRGEQVVLLEALATDPRPALQVQATGGEVTAVLQDSRLRGLVPAGTDLVTAGTAPAAEVVIPGVVLGEDTGQGDDAATVRVVNPGGEPVTAHLDLLGADGLQPVPGADALVVDPGAVIDVSLEGLPAGSWTARIRADGPVTGAAMLTAAGEPSEGQDSPPLDRTWLPAAGGVSTGAAALPQTDGFVSSAVLVLANAADEPVDAEVVPVLADGTRGEPTAQRLASETSAALSVADLAEEPVIGLEVRAPDAVVHAALTLAHAGPDGSLVSALPVTEDARAAQAVAVVPSVRSVR